MGKKKLAILIIAVVIAVASIGGITYAVWQEINNVDSDINNQTGDWNESAKYIEYEAILDGGTQIGWRVIGYSGLIADVAVPGIYEDYNVLEIGRAFMNNNVVSSVVVPNTVISISDSAFYNATRLTKITILGGVETSYSIGDYAFVGCGMLSVYANNRTITSIGTDAFAGCTMLDAAPTVG